MDLTNNSFFAAHHQAVHNLRAKFHERLTPFYTDYALVRFLRARDWDLERASAMLETDIAWRAKTDIDNIFETFPKHPQHDAMTGK
jgi:hypothetical protein